MHVITRESLAKSATKKWAEQYPVNSVYNQDKQEVLKNLVALGGNPIPDEVDNAIGNNSWTQTICHECSSTGVPVIVLGQPEDYDSCTASVCKPCLLKAIDII